MARRLRRHPLLRLVLILSLALPSLSVWPLKAQEPSPQWQALEGPGGRLTLLASSRDGRALYAVSEASVNRAGDQTQWREAGVPTESDALYASDDAGSTWQAVTNDLPPGWITAVFVDHADRLWAGVQMRSDLPERHNGLWRSEDRGGTWRNVPLDRDDLIIRSIVEDASGQIFFGAVDAGGLDQGFVYRTSDAGTTWTSNVLSFRSNEPLARLERLVVHPIKAGVLTALGTNSIPLRSTDGGVSWLEISASESADPGSAQLVFLPDAPDTAVLVQSQATTTSVFRSVDAGASWSEIQTSGLTSSPLSVRSMLALPHGVLLLNTDAGTYRSADGGSRWQPLEGALSSGFVHEWVGKPSNALAVLAATDYGLFESTDGGAIWRAYGTGLPQNSKVAALLTHEDRPTQIVASLGAPEDADPPELVITRDSGKTWLPADGGAAWSDGTAWAIDPNNADNLFVAGANYVATSTDGGFSWKVHPVAQTIRTAIAVAPSDSSRIYVDGNPVLRSDDSGETWSGLPLATQGGDVETATGLTVDPADAQHLWRGGADGIRESRDGGNTWERAGLDGETVHWLATSGGGKDQAPLTLFAGLANGGMMRRMNGADWTPADGGLPSGSVVTAFVADPRTPGLLWAGRDGGGIYRSTDGGSTWANAGAGVGDNLGLALAVNYQAPESVLMGTATAGLWAWGSAAPSGAAARLATGTPQNTPTSIPGARSDQAGVDARIEVVWPHNFAPIDQAELANVGIRLFMPNSLEPPACGWRPKVQLWRAIDNEPAEPVELADQRSVDGQPFPYWEANDVDVSAARDPERKAYFLTTVEGVDTATSVWAHAADARTYLPEQEVPSGLATGAVDAVDAQIQIVWPHDDKGAEASVAEATLANVVVTLFKHGTRLSVPPSWSAPVTLYGAWNSETARPFAIEANIGSRQAGVITYPVWEFNDVPVDRAREGTSKLYLWAVAKDVTSYPSIWAHGADSRTFFPAQDEPIEGCQP